MFKAHYDTMRPGPTPERVLSIARMLALQPMTVQEIVQRCELREDVQQASEGIRLSISTAEELELITKKDGVCLCTAGDDVLSTPASFRQYVAGRVLNDPNTTFFKVTEWFVSANDSIMSFQNFSTYRAEIGKAGISNIDGNDVLGWRFWVRFLGIAYQFNSTLIPNMAVRLNGAMRELPIETNFVAVDFLSWLKEHIREAASSCSQRQLCLAVSNGLRTLEALDKIQLISVMDADKVNLFPLSGVPVNDFSKIVVKGASHDEMA